MNSSTPKQQAESHLAQLVHREKVPGIQYVVVGPEGIRFEHCSGLMDVSSNLPVTPSTTFMASSVTKTLTAAAVLQLHDQGQLDLKASLSACYPSHPYGMDLRINQLVNQTSGVPNPMPLRWLHVEGDHHDYDEDGALKDVLTRHPKLRFAPGSRYAYSNLAYWLLGKVIEQVSQIPYADYMRNNIFDPLDISTDEMGCQIPDLKRHACGHLKRFSGLGILMPLMMSKEVFAQTVSGRRRFKPVYMNGPAYGGLIATALGLSKFMQDQLRPGSALFGKETKELFFCQQSDNRGRPIETTLGWHRGEVLGTEYFGKPGGGPGFQSNIRIYPEKAIATVWLANETAASEGPIHALSNNLDRYFL
jgi:CubicO group peptidase (beta-lactamase class C family)